MLPPIGAAEETARCLEQAPIRSIDGQAHRWCGLTGSASTRRRRLGGLATGCEHADQQPRDDHANHVITHDNRSGEEARVG
jgi:hypothetical protein